MKYDKLQTHCCAFINYSIFFAKITQFAWAISKNVREIRSSACNYYTSEAHLELDTRAVRYIRWEKSSREERQERIKPVLDLETQLIVSILNILLHCIANHDLIAQSNKYLHLNAKVVIAVAELLDSMRYALSLFPSASFICWLCGNVRTNTVMFTSEIWTYLSIHLVLNEFNVKTIRLMQYDVIDIANFYSFFFREKRWLHAFTTSYFKYLYH